VRSRVGLAVFVLLAAGCPESVDGTGTTEISGNVTGDSARRLAATLEADPLPIPLYVAKVTKDG
jgi:hypothetical protein